jgi:6-phosphogluconolactonase
VCSIDSSGGLRRLGWQRDGVAFPRDITVDPGGKVLLVANQNRQTIAAYDIDADTGMLAVTGEIVRFASPSCLVFLR